MPTKASLEAATAHIEKNSAGIAYDREDVVALAELLDKHTDLYRDMLASVVGDASFRLFAMGDEDSKTLTALSVEVLNNARELLGLNKV